MASLTGAEVDQLLRPLTVKDLRVQLRVRGQTPAGSIDTLRQRLKDHMLETKDFAIKSEAGEDLTTVTVTAGASATAVADGALKNNYSRPGGEGRERRAGRGEDNPGWGCQRCGAHMCHGAVATAAAGDRPTGIMRAPLPTGTPAAAVPVAGRLSAMGLGLGHV